MICYKKAKKLLLIVTLNGSISNNIGATTVQCVHSSRGWTGRNLILDEGLGYIYINMPTFFVHAGIANIQCTSTIIAYFVDYRHGAADDQP